MRYKVSIALSLHGTVNRSQTFYFPLQHELQAAAVSYQRPAALFVVAGLEDDLPAFCGLLKKQRIIDRHLKWQFGDGHLVVLGSNVNQEPPNIESLWFLYALEENARQAGGRVHFMVGRQVLAHINGNWRFNHPAYATKHLRANKPVTALYGANQELWRWLQTKHTAAQIGKALFATILPDPEAPSLLPPMQDHDQPSAITSEAAIDAIRYQLQVKTIITVADTEAPFTSLYHGKVLQVSSLPFEGITAGLKRSHKRLFIVNSKGKKVKIKTPRHESTVSSQPDPTQ